MDNNEHTVLCLDDEQNILNALKRLLRKENYHLLTCTTGDEGLQLLSQNEVQVVISDQRMPEMSGTEFLKQVKELYPDIIRIILTGYTDVETISNSINQGHIYKFFLKPWNDQHLTLEIRQALEQYDLIKANKRLHEVTLEQNDELKAINENLESIVAERTSFLEMQNQALQLSQAILEDLPFPIIGISTEMMVALVNGSAQQRFSGEDRITVGEHIDEYLTGMTEGSLEDVITSSRSQCVICQGKKSGRKYHLEIYPLTGRFSGSGCIITLPKVGSEKVTPLGD
jgi:response regulator RpfG family c-di-GMP phosphodiesterase